MRTCLNSFYLVIARILSLSKETKQSHQLEIATPVFGLVRNDSEKGQTLIELLLAIGLTAIILPAILTGLVASRSGKVQQALRLEAVALLKEAQEAVRNVREKDWNTFAVNGTFHPQISASSWILATGSATIDGFTRQVVISDVERDANGAIVLTGGTLDPSTKKVVTTISWTTPTPSFVTSTTYIARLDNITYTETLEAEFDAGTKTGVSITNTSGGEIVLSAGGGGDWCEPATPSALTSFDLPKSGVANAVSAIEGVVFAGTGNNASGVSFQKVNISNANPPVPSAGATFDGYKTNDTFGETNYAYLATDTNSKEIVIMDLNQYSDPPTNSKYLEVGSFDSSGPTDGNSVYAVGNVGYMTAGSTFYTFDLSSHTGSRSQKSSRSLAGTGNKIVVLNNKAYIAVNSASTQLQIIDVSNPDSLPAPVNISVAGQGGRNISVNQTGTRAYLATAVSAAQKEFFLIDVDSTSATYKNTLGSYDTNGMDPKGVAVVTSNKAVVVGTSAEEYQVIDISDESSPSRCGGLDIDTGVNGVSSVLEQDGDAYSYIITGDANAELKIIPGGAGGGQYVSDGTFESQTIPIPMPVNETSFNRFEVSVNRPSLADIQFQVAVEQAIAGSCNGVTFNFVGPDGTSSTFFTTSVTSGIQTFDYSIPTAINPGQCFRYKEFLSTSDSSQSPIFYDITINYAP